MPLTLHSLKSFPKKRRKRVGRGFGSGHGRYSTRGIKGQRSRSGGKAGLKLKGAKRRIMALPKIGGFKSIHPKPAIINLDKLADHFNEGDKVNPEILLKKGLIKKIKAGVKILGNGEINKRLIIEDCQISKGAREKIEKAGGLVSSLSEV
jgi:large subunit ribosomal protein L15